MSDNSLIKAVLQFQCERIVVVPHDVQDLLLGGGAELLGGQPSINPGLEVGGDGPNIDQTVSDPHGGVLVFPARGGVAQGQAVQVVEGLVAAHQLVV